MKIVVPGPLHPDFFDGMTPIMTEVEGRAFDVKVTWTTTTSERYTVVAENEEQAREIAEVMAERDAIDSPDEFEYEIEELDDGEGATLADVEASRKILEEINAKPVQTFARSAR